MTNVLDAVSLSETVDTKVNAPLAGVDPLAGQAVQVCIVCGKILGDPYPAAKKAPKVTPCHEARYVREDYAPSVKLDADKLKAGELVAVAGEPMDHVRARAAAKE
jgi:hypothetical protein